MSFIFLHVSKRQNFHQPVQTPGSVIGSLERQSKGLSQWPEKSPGPPHASPSVFEQTLQHLQFIRIERLLDF